MTSPHTKPCLILETPRSRGGHGYVVVTSTDAPDHDDIFEALRSFKSDGDRSPYLGVSEKAVHIERSGTSRTGEETLLLLPPSGAVWNETDKIEIRSALSQLLKKEIDLLITGDGVGQDGENSILYRDPRLNRFAEGLSRFDWKDVAHAKVSLANDPASESADSGKYRSSSDKNFSRWLFIAIACVTILAIASMLVRSNDPIEPNDKDVVKIVVDGNGTEIHLPTSDDDELDADHRALLMVLDTLASEKSTLKKIEEADTKIKNSLSTKNMNDFDTEWIKREAESRHVDPKVIDELCIKLGFDDNQQFLELALELKKQLKK